MFRCGIEWFFGEEEKNINRKPSPLVGEGVNRQVDGRGKRKEKQKNDFDLCTQTCPYRLARLGTSRPKAKRLIAFSRRYAPKNTIRLPPSSGEADIKEERNYSFYMSKTSKYGNSTQKSVFVPAYIFHFYRGRAIKKAPL